MKQTLTFNSQCATQNFKPLDIVHRLIPAFVYRAKYSALSIAFALLAACASNTSNVKIPTGHPSVEEQIAGLHIVDCLLPGQVRSLGKTTYLTPRRPIKTTAADCNLRGGEFVAYDRANYQSALRVWLPAAEAGDANAQVSVGEIFERGANGEPNYAAAAIWYQKAAKQDNRRGQFNLGTLYEQGLGVKKDPVKALNLYRLAWGLPEDNVMFQSVARNQQAVLESKNKALNEQQALLSEQQELLRAQLSGVLQAKNTQIQALRKQINQLENEYRTSVQKFDAQKSAHEAQINSAKRSVQSNNVDQQETLLEAKNSELNKRAEIIDQQSELLNQQAEIIDQKDTQLEQQAKIAETQNAALIKQGDTRDQQAIDEVLFAEQKTEIDQLKALVTSLEAERNTAQLEISALPRLRTPEKRSSTDPLAFEQKKQSSPIKTKGINFGRYFALIIGNQNYQFIENLETTQNDALKMAEILENGYGFDVKLLLNADRVTVMETINNLNAQLTEEDNLLIYYAGHGSRVQVGPQEQAYWLPVNADPPPKDSFWVSSEFVTSHLARYKAKRVLVVADSCYAGLLSSSPGHLFLSQGAEQDLDYIRYKLPRRARLLITSGGDKPVIDSGGNGHSVFARVLLETLENNKEILSAPKLFLGIKEKVKNLASANKFVQTPDFKSIKGAGHEVGDFFFIPKS